MMTKTALKERIDAARALLERVDRDDPDALFDCLVELEILANDDIAEYGVAKLLQARRRPTMPAVGRFSTAA